MWGVSVMTRAGMPPSHCMRLASMSTVPSALSLMMDLPSCLWPMCSSGQLEQEFAHILSQAVPFSTLGAILRIRSLKYRISWLSSRMT